MPSPTTSLRRTLRRLKPVETVSIDTPQDLFRAAHSIDHKTIWLDVPIDILSAFPA